MGSPGSSIAGQVGQVRGSAVRTRPDTSGRSTAAAILYISVVWRSDSSVFFFGWFGLLLVLFSFFFLVSFIHHQAEQKKKKKKGSDCDSIDAIDFKSDHRIRTHAHDVGGALYR